MLARAFTHYLKTRNETGTLTDGDSHLMFCCRAMERGLKAPPLHYVPEHSRRQTSRRVVAVLGQPAAEHEGARKTVAVLEATAELFGLEVTLPTSRTLLRVGMIPL